jgi:hypothetical protein
MRDVSRTNPIRPDRINAAKRARMKMVTGASTPRAPMIQAAIKAPMANREP